jgi:hypothetical protein
MSWHYLRVQVEESLQDICSGGELLQPLRSKITHAEFYCNGKLMDSYLDSLSGTTFAHSMESLGEEKSMLSQEDSLAKICQQQEKAKGLTESDQDSGGKWQGSFAKYNPDTHSLRTPQCLLFEDSTEFCAILPKWGLMLNGVCWEQQTLVQTISVIVYGLNPNEMTRPPPPHIYIWTTPTAHMSKETNAPSEHRRNTPTLTAQVNQRWPTPTVCGNYNRKGASATSGEGLATAVQKWPTPDASAHKYRLSGNSQQSNSLMALAGGKLNPDWTEWLMGWPPGWTDLKPLEMDKSHSVPQPHGDS